MACDIADFPKPAGPLSQHIGWPLLLSAHFASFAITSRRVPGWQLARDGLESYVAPMTGVSMSSIAEVDHQNNVQIVLVSYFWRDRNC